MAEISLNGDWVLHYRESVAQPAGSIDHARAGGYASIPARVPGSVELDLVRSGELPDLFVGDNITRAHELEHGDWWFVRTFDLPERDGERTSDTERVIRFDGLDTFAEIHLNGVHIGSAGNMLIGHEFVATSLQAGRNEIVVHIRSTIREAEKFDYAPRERDVFQHPESVWIRKPPHMFGWNVTPRLVSAGIWRSVTLVERKRQRLADLYVYTKSISPEGSAVLGFHCQLAQGIDLRTHTLRVRGANAGTDKSFETEVPITFKAKSFEVEVPDASLWWPRPLGAPELYDLVVDLVADGVVIDTWTDRIGIRTLSVTQGPLPLPEGALQVTVNAIPIDVLGTNWVPLDAIHARDRDRLAGALDLLAASNCNLVRVWGGGVYEDDEFYEWCDANGVLVWQDFALACAFYPQDERFQRALTEEAEHVIKRLRNRPSLAVWAGNNENDQVILSEGGDPEEDLTSRVTLLRVCGRLDPYRSYLPSAPYIPSTIGDRLQGPDQHLWAFPPYFKDPAYSQNTAGFIGEIGFYGSPDEATLAYISGGDPEIPSSESRVWRLHETSDLKQPDVTPVLPIDVMTGQAEYYFGRELRDVGDYVFASQVAQAEAFKYIIEMVRADPQRTGVVWWSLFDTWPSISASVSDYFFTKKVAFDFIRAAQAPVGLMVAERDGWNHSLIGRNDTLRDESIEFNVFDGETKAVLAGGKVVLKANCSAKIAEFPVYLHGHRLVGISWKTSAGRFGNHYVEGHPPFDLERFRVTWMPVIRGLHAER